MIEVTTEMFSEVFLPPAIVLKVKDFALARVELPDQPDYVGLVLELRHPEMPNKFRQLYSIPVAHLADLAEQFTIYYAASGGQLNG